MARIKGGLKTRQRRKGIMKLAKGYFGARSRQFKAANETVMKALKYAYRDRRAKKRDFRKLWITRINAASRINGMSYSKFMNALKKSNIVLNRKVLADMAVNDREGFAQLVQKVRDVK